MTILQNQEWAERHVMRTLSTKAHIALGQTFLVTTLLLVALVTGLIPDRRSAVQEGRVALAEALAANGSAQRSRLGLTKVQDSGWTESASNCWRNSGRVRTRSRP